MGDEPQCARRGATLYGAAGEVIVETAQPPEMISFAAGQPAIRSFAAEALRRLCDRQVTARTEDANPHGAIEGYRPLRQWVAAAHGADVSNVLITSGSRQGLDLIANAFISPGCKVLVEAPTRSEALQAFSACRPTFAEIPGDERGLQPQWLTEDLAANARFLYTMPDFQDPTGRRLSGERRRQLVTLAHAHGVLLVEDNSYGDLRYRDTALPSLYSMNPAGVIHLGSWSELFSPRLPLGYIIAPQALHDRIVQAKRKLKLHTPECLQHAGYRLLESGTLQREICAVRDQYGRQCSAMLKALSRYMPLGVRWTAPHGGMFIWIELPSTINAEALLDDALARNVSFAPGACFHAAARTPNTLRLNFVAVAPENIDRGAALLGGLITRHL
ncbi:PLP-dependent aminotransferase family protein [Paraburkholderia sp. J7]|uniref:aminotransferase-like domain-containing protein n=1 Tax=Paraburkholderia sp. J7 TaxID=2805438 RepID=UPI002AB62AD0|nr:PLP-dependent aminotransferase family protein [Paraburkholderia sp. J7]